MEKGKNLHFRPDKPGKRVGIIYSYKTSFSSDVVEEIKDAKRSRNVHQISKFNVKVAGFILSVNLTSIKRESYLSLNRLPDVYSFQLVKKTRPLVRSFNEH